MTKAYFILRSTNRVIETMIWTKKDKIRGELRLLQRRLKELNKKHMGGVYINIFKSIDN